MMRRLRIKEDEKKPRVHIVVVTVMRVRMYVGYLKRGV